MTGRDRRFRAALSREDLASDYAEKLDIFEALLREASYALEAALERSGIKIHAVEGRVKDLQSIFRKMEDKELSNPLLDLVDVVGIRPVCLFRSDMERVHEIIRQTFDIDSIDDKVNGSVDTFGYMSTHYICRLKDSYVGPRYDQLKGMRFEVQSRTLCMHAWAAISHHLSYKGDWDVPIENRKSINALSGLFYIADNEFERAYQNREASLATSLEEVKSGALQDAGINLDTVTAYLQNKYPDRRHSISSYSEFVQNLLDAGYSNIAEVDGDIEKAALAFAAYESERPPTDSPYFSDLGVARISLGIGSDRFYAVAKDKLSKDVPSYRKYLK